jgi:hypothetical protein
LDWLLGHWGGGEPSCQVSGHRFTTERVEHALVKMPFAPSLDRIDPQAGYTQDNVRVVCTIVNFAMNQWGEAYLKRIVASMLLNDPDRLVEEAESTWALALAARIDEASLAVRHMEGVAAARQRRRIAGLKASLTKGTSGLRAAAAKAVATRRATTSPTLPRARRRCGRG